MNRFGINLLWVALREYDDTLRPAPHTHPEGVYHYMYVIRGKGWIRIADKTFAFAPGQMYLTGPGVTHAFDHDLQDPLVTVELKFQILDAALDEKMRSMPFALDARKNAVGQRVWDMWQEKDKGNLMYQQVLAAQAYELMCLLQRLAVEQQWEDPKARASLEPALRYMRAHLGQPITLTELADAVHLDRVYFAKKFKKVMGLAPMEYLRNARIEQAKEWMVVTDKSITQIAEELGFQTLQHFSAVFLKATGLSPRKYMQALKRQ
jgi:AraC-like DNA-binding protein